mgnify:CR=1 FL=1
MAEGPGGWVIPDPSRIRRWIREADPPGNHELAMAPRVIGPARSLSGCTSCLLQDMCPRGSDTYRTSIILSQYVSLVGRDRERTGSVSCTGLGSCPRAVTRRCECSMSPPGRVGWRRSDWRVGRHSELQNFRPRSSAHPAMKYRVRSGPGPGAGSGGPSRSRS